MALRLFRGKDDRLTAYAPAASGGVFRWTEDRPGSVGWTGPVLFEVPELKRGPTAAQGADGYVHLVGLRLKGTEDTDRTDTMYATQFQTGRPLTVWRAMGTPHPKDAKKARRTGTPAAAVGAKGVLHVFERNAGGGVSARQQDTKGKWAGWRDLKGQQVAEMLSAVATGDGRVEVLATAPDRILRWYQPEPGGDFQRGEDIPAHPQAGSLSAVVSGRDTVTHFWRDKSGEVFAWRPDTEASVSLGGGSGVGPVAAARAEIEGHDCTVLAQRDGVSGRLAIAAYPTEDEGAGVWWTPSGEPGQGEPAMARDGFGLLVVAAMTPDGGLLVARQKTDEAGLALRAWSRV